MSVKAVVKINNVDISSYLYASSLVPIVNRNRDYTPIFEGIRLTVSSNVPNEPLKGQEVLITVNDTQDVFIGFINDIIFNQDLSLWEVEVYHWLLKLEKFFVKYSDLHNDLVLESIDEAATWKDFTVNATDDYIVDVNHGLTSGTKIVFKTTGTLPAPLVNTNRYYVKVIDANNFRIYADYALIKDDEALGVTNNRHVNITNSGTGTHSYTVNVNNKKYNDWSFYRDIKCAKGPTNQFYSRLLPNNNVYPMKLNYPRNPDKEEYNLIMFDTDGTLPTGLTKNRAYIAAYENLAGQWFQIYNTWNDYVYDHAMSPGATGSGQLWFTVLRRKSGDANLWTSMPTAIIQLKFLIETIFKKIGVVLDTTLIDNVIQYRWITSFQSYKWDDIYFMESILYNIYQTKPVNHANIESDTTLLELVQDIFKRLGIMIRLKNGATKEFELISQAKDEFGRIRLDLEPNWIIGQTESDSYAEKNIYGTLERGWQYSHNHVSVVGSEALSFIFNNRTSKTFEQYLENNYRLKDKFGQGLSDFSVPLNLIFFLYDKFETNGTNNVFMIRDGLSLNGKELLLNPNYTPSTNALTATGQYSLYDVLQTIIEFRLELFNQDIYSIKEIWLDIKKDAIKIIQETNLFTSS